MNGFIDWSHEREWRKPDDFKFRIDWTGVVLETKENYREFIEKSTVEENTGILENICGIVVLDALLM